MSFFTRALSRPLFRSLEERVSVALFALLLLFASTHQLLAHGFKLGDLEIGHPWSRATPAGAKVAAGYLVVKNTGSQPDRLVSIQSDVSEKAEIHEMAVDAAGVMKMRQIGEGVEIPAGGEVAFKPGSYHIMFVGLKAPVKEGEKFAGTLTFEKAGAVTVEFAVDAMGGQTQDHSGH
ncbi:copper chaperone PCu(A)C [Aminobacter sp. HY435]|uniref:copper chaperone PCu(A)C n=1 Tax=Aminobacter sp. HY435 TaxID=2970917 RepID=UPI0022B9B167|nr:copper chaperone PCu(A)C [Aminobacter sp. HY435]